MAETIANGVHSSPDLPAVAADMAQAATRLIDSLSAAQKARALYSEDHYERLYWNYAPMQYRGLPLGEMEPPQQAMTFDLLATGLSEDGADRARQIANLEVVLGEMEAAAGTGVFPRDPGGYYLRIFGTPGSDAWSWSLNGHHIFAAFTLVQGRAIASTPNFLGSNPAVVPHGYEGAGTGVLWDTDERARELLGSLDKHQRTRAIVSDLAPLDIYTLNSPILVDGPGSVLPPSGLSAGDMNAGQRDRLWDLVAGYVNRLRPELAAPILEGLKADDFGRFDFSWAGGDQPGQGRYFRIHRLQPGSFLIEQDNVQNEANHIHSVMRDLDEDFGVNLLRHHYETAHQPGAGHSH
jgi:hypothetical protein